MEALVVGRRQPENPKQRAIASPRVFETTMNERREIIAGQFVSLEGLVHDDPEVLASDQSIPKSIGCAGTALESSRRRHRFLSDRQ